MLQRHFIETDDKILIIIDRRDAAGKDDARQMREGFDNFFWNCLVLDSNQSKDRVSLSFLLSSPLVVSVSEVRASKMN